MNITCLLHHLHHVNRLCRYFYGIRIVQEQRYYESQISFPSVTQIFLDVEICNSTSQICCISVVGWPVLSVEFLKFSSDL